MSMTPFAIRGDGPAVHRADCHHVLAAIGPVELLSRAAAQALLDEDVRRRRCGLCRPNLTPAPHGEHHLHSLRSPLPGPRPTTVYRFYDAAGVLLYVGKTTDAAGRWSQHRKTQEWWPSVATVAVSHFDSESDAYAAEAAAIRGEHPLHNQAQGRS